MTEIIKASLLPVNDAPAHLQAELAQMAWLTTQDLWQITHSTMPDDEQAQMQRLSQQQATTPLNTTETAQLEALCQEYGRLTFLKVHAYALLSLRGGPPY